MDAVKKMKPSEVLEYLKNGAEEKSKITNVHPTDILAYTKTLPTAIYGEGLEWMSGYNGFSTRAKEAHNSLNSYKYGDDFKSFKANNLTSTCTLISDTDNYIKLFTDNKAAVDERYGEGTSDNAIANLKEAKAAIEGWNTGLNGFGDDEGAFWYIMTSPDGAEELITQRDKELAAAKQKRDDDYNREVKNAPKRTETYALKLLEQTINYEYETSVAAINEKYASLEAALSQKNTYSRQQEAYEEYQKGRTYDVVKSQIKRNNLMLQQAKDVMTDDLILQDFYRIGLGGYHPFSEDRLVTDEEIEWGRKTYTDERIQKDNERIKEFEEQQEKLDEMLFWTREFTFRDAEQADDWEEYNKPVVNAKTEQLRDGMRKYFTDAIGFETATLVFDYIKQKANWSTAELAYEIVNGLIAGVENTDKRTDSKYFAYSELSDIEKSRYFYIANKFGKEDGLEYLEWLTEGKSYYIDAKGNKITYADNLISRYGTKIGQEAGFFDKIGISFGAGIDQFSSGIKTVFTGKVKSGQTINDYAFASARENSGMLTRFAMDMTQTTSNMLPSILVSAAIGAVSKTAGSIVGATLLGASAAGNAYSEAINNGFSVEEAQAYGFLVGLSETCLEYAIGGITKLGGKVSGNYFAKALGAMDSGFMKGAIKLAASGLSEGIEEGLQEILEPLFLTMVTGTKFKFPDWEDIGYAALLGFCSAGIFDITEAVNYGSILSSTQVTEQIRILQSKSKYSAEYNVAEILAKAVEADPDIDITNGLIKGLIESEKEKIEKSGYVMTKEQVQEYISACKTQPADSVQYEAAVKIDQLQNAGVQITAAIIGAVTADVMLEKSTNAVTGTDTAESRNVFEETKLDYDRTEHHGQVLEVIRNHFDEVKDLTPVSKLTGKEFQKTEGDTRGLKQKIKDFFNGLGNKVYRDGLGEIALNNAGVNDSLGHGYGRLKASTFAALPEVLSKGVIIEKQGPYKGHQYDSYFIAAPVTVGKESVYVSALVIKDSNMQRYKVHEVLTINKDGTPLFKTGTQTMSDSRNDVSSSATIISNPAENINSQISQNTDPVEADKQVRDAAEDGYVEHDWQMSVTNPGVMEQAAARGMKKSDVKKLAELSRILNLKIFLYTNSEEKARGYYDNVSDVIFINAASKSPVMKTFAHELTHRLQASGLYERLHRYVIGTENAPGKLSRMTGKSIETLRAEKRGDYASAQVRQDLSSDIEVDYELVAEYVEEYLFKDGKHIEDICRSAADVSRNIVKTIENWLNKLGGLFNQEKRSLNKIRKMYQDILADRVHNGYNRNTDAVREIESASEQLQNGEISEEQFDAAYDEYGQFDLDEKLPSEHKYAIEKGNKSEKYSMTESEDDRNGREEVSLRTGRAAENINDEGIRVLQENRRRGTQNGDRLRNGRSNSKKVVRVEDSEGNRVSKEKERVLKDSAIRDKSGRLLAVYHGTLNSFETFKIGDIGFHFGNILQAHKRVESTETEGNSRVERYIRAYLNIKNPAVLTRDQYGWNPKRAAWNLWADDVITESERQEIITLSMEKAHNDIYNSPAAIRLREILESKGYDGIAYPNGFEGEGTSYIAFYDEQIVRAPAEETETGDGGDPSVDKEMPQTQENKLHNTRSYAVETRTAEQKADVLSRVRSYLNGDISKSDLQSYIDDIDGKNRSNTRNSIDSDAVSRRDLSLPNDAKDIVRAAREAKISVDEYLRRNWENYELDGEYNTAAREALNYERSGKGRSYAILKNVTDENGKKYDSVVKLEYGVFNKVKHDAKAFIDFIRNNLINKKITVYDENGDTEVIEFARVNERVTKDGNDKSHKVLGELERAKGPLKRLTILNAEETVQISKTESRSTENTHKWLDQNGWEKRTAYVMDGNGVIYPAYLSIAKANDGRNILYAVNVKVNDGVAIAIRDTLLTQNDSGSRASSQHRHLDDMVSHPDPKVKPKNNRSYAIEDPDIDSSVDTEPRAIDSMPRKVRNTIKKAENTLKKTVRQIAGIPVNEENSSFYSFAEKLSEEYMANGRISDETVDRLVGELYERGIVIERELYDQYADLRAEMRKIQIYVNESQIAEIKYNTGLSFKDFRNRYMGRLNLTSKKGSNTLGVDEVYSLWAENFPGLFNEEQHSVSEDQLLHIAEIADMLRKVERDISGIRGGDGDFIRLCLKNDFINALNKYTNKMAAAKRYEDSRAAEAAKEHVVPQTMKELFDLWEDLGKRKREWKKAESRYLLTNHDKMQVGRLLRGEIQLEHLNPEQDNIEGITEVMYAQAEYEADIKLLREYQRQRKAELLSDADKLLVTSADWHDKKIGKMYQLETLERNIRDLVSDPEPAQLMVDEYYKPIKEANAAITRAKEQYRDRIRTLNLSTKETQAMLREGRISESHAVQLIGEAENYIREINESKGRKKKVNGKTAKEWQNVINEIWVMNPDMDQAKIHSAIREFRKLYDELFTALNEVRMRNGFEPIHYRQGYFPHFQPDGGGELALQFGDKTGIDIKVPLLPTSINGLTHLFKPGIAYFGAVHERLGFDTVYDAVEGFDRYLEGAMDVIYHTDNIQRLRALASQIRYQSTTEGVREQIDKVMADTSLSEQDRNNRIRDIYDEAPYRLSNFVVYLDEYTNILAGKKSIADRNMEYGVGRQSYNIVGKYYGRVAANMIAGNLASALTNFIPLAQAWSVVSTVDLLQGMYETLRNYHDRTGFVNSSDFLTSRRGSDILVQTWTEKASSIAIKPMELIDNFTSESIVRAKYNQNIKAGMSQEAALADADTFAERLMADRSKGAMPTIFYQKNPFTKIFTQFQLEQNNQLRFMVKDLPQYAIGKGAAYITAMVFKLILGAYLFNDAYELVVGRRPAFDVLGIANDLAGDLTGYKLPNTFALIGDAVFGDGIHKNDFEEGAPSLKKAGINLVDNILEEIPFVGGLAGGGRVPISSALPAVGTLWSAISTDGWAMSKRFQTAGKELLKVAAYVVPPFGGGQLKRLIEGGAVLAEGGSYTINNKGEKQLQIAGPDNIIEAVQLMVFGKTSLPTAKEWIDNGLKTLSVKETAAYLSLADQGELKKKEIYALLKELKSYKKKALATQALADMDISEDAKGIVYYSLYATEAERKMLDEIESIGGNWMSAAASLAYLQPEKGKNTVSKGQKLLALCDADLEKQDIKKAASNILSDKQMSRMKLAEEYQISVWQYLKIRYEVLPMFDENNNGSYSKNEIKTALKNILEGHEKLNLKIPAQNERDLSLTTAQCAVLYQIFLEMLSSSNSTNPSDNPFSYSIGRKAAEKLEALQKKERTAAAEEEE